MLCLELYIVTNNITPIILVVILRVANKMGCYIMLYYSIYLIVGYHCVSSIITIMYIITQRDHHTIHYYFVWLARLSAHFDLSPSAKFLFLKFLVENVRIIVIPYFIVCMCVRILILIVIIDYIIAFLFEMVDPRSAVYFYLYFFLLFEATSCQLLCSFNCVAHLIYKCVIFFFLYLRLLHECWLLSSIFMCRW